MAGGLGFEPRLTESESAVLPLDDPPKNQDAIRWHLVGSRPACDCGCALADNPDLAGEGTQFNPSIP